MTNLDERTNTLLYKNIPFTLYSRKGYERVDVGYVWEVSWRRRETATYWPQVPLTIPALLPHSAGLLNRRSWGPKPSVWSWVSLRHFISDWNCNSNSNWRLELIASNSPKPSVAPGYIIVWHPPASCGRTYLHRIQPRPQVKVLFRYLRPDAPVSAVPLLIYTGASLDWRLGRGPICNIFTRIFSQVSLGPFPGSLRIFGTVHHFLHCFSAFSTERSKFTIFSLRALSLQISTNSIVLKSLGFGLLLP